ncbi:MAG: DUF655 domain-containing protein [Candidatus Micrarchaeota archaeon]
MNREDFALLLDHLPHGKSGEAVKESLAQVVGDVQFTLLEVVVKPDVKFDLFEKVYIGAEERDKVDHIKQRISFDQLTVRAQQELEQAIRLIVVSREKELVAFLNKAGSISVRSHTLEQLPSVGKKHLSALLSEREKTPFESFADVQKRIPHLVSVQELFIQRILAELKGIEKYYLFVKPPRREQY